MGVAGKSVVALSRRSLWAFIRIKSRCARVGKGRAQRQHLTMAKTGKPTRPMLGAHMSIAGEVGESLNRGKQVGCECIQIFTKSSRQWASKPFTKEEIEKFKRNRIETGITTVIAHDSYLVNLGAPDEAMRTKSVKGFIDELHRCEALGVPILVAHPGSHVGSGVENWHQDDREIDRRGARGVQRLQGEDRARNHGRPGQQPGPYVRADGADFRRRRRERAAAAVLRYRARIRRRLRHSHSGRI